MSLGFVMAPPPAPDFMAPTEDAAPRELAYHMARRLLTEAGHATPLPEDVLTLAQWLTEPDDEDDEPAAAPVDMRDGWPPVILSAARLALLGMVGLFALYGVIVFLSEALG